MARLLGWLVQLSCGPTNTIALPLYELLHSRVEPSDIQGPFIPHPLHFFAIIKAYTHLPDTYSFFVTLTTKRMAKGCSVDRTRYRFHCM